MVLYKFLFYKQIKIVCHSEANLWAEESSGITFPGFFADTQNDI